VAQENVSDYAKLTREIEQHNDRIYTTSLVLLGFMLVAWIVSLDPRYSYSITAIPAIGVGWAWSMVRADFLMRRAGIHLAITNESPWELSWPRHFRKILLAPFDGLSMFPFLFFMFMAETTCWNLPRLKPYAVATSLLFVSGAGAIGWVTAMFETEAKKRHWEGRLQEPVFAETSEENKKD
jgi:hypothetical protein